MKFTRRDAAKLLALPVLFHASKQVFPEAAAASRNDPALREAVQAAMLEYIDAAKIRGYSLIFDPIKGNFVKARFKKLHNNLALVADSFYVSCADYETEEGKLLDVDFMVAEQDGFYAVFQSVIHMRDGKLRGQHMEFRQAAGKPQSAVRRFGYKDTPKVMRSGHNSNAKKAVVKIAQKL